MVENSRQSKEQTLLYWLIYAEYEYEYESAIACNQNTFGCSLFLELSILLFLGVFYVEYIFINLNPEPIVQLNVGFLFLRDIFLRYIDVDLHMRRFRSRVLLSCLLIVFL